MNKSERFFWCICAFLAGIVVGNFVFEEAFLKAVVLVLLYFALVARRGSIADKIIFLFFVIFGGLRLILVLNQEPVGLDMELATIKGYVVEEVDVRDDKVKYTLKVPEIGTFLVDAPRYPFYEFGDELRVEGRLQNFFVEEGFDYGKYLKLHGIDYWFKAKSLGKTGELDLSFWQSFKNMLFISKAKLENKIDEFFPEPYGNFLKGLLTGSRRGINVEIAQHFQVVGLSHVVAISGYNITLLIVVVGAGLGFLKKNLRILFSAIFILMFVLLVGASAAVVRAGVMGGISLLALYFGRSYMAFRALFLTAGVMCAFNPMTLVYDSGFQLSFLSTLGIVAVSPYLEAILEKVRESFLKLLVFEAVSSTLISMMMTLPILLTSFGGLSLISPLANLMVLPLISFVMFFGFMAIFVGSLIPILGKFFAFFAYVLIKYIFFVADYLSALSFSFLQMQAPDFYVCALYYFVLAILILRKNLT